MNVVDRTTSHSSEWRRAFADALIRFRPDMNPDAADELSDSAFLSLREMSPRDAAALCAKDGAISHAARAASSALRGR